MIQAVVTVLASLLVVGVIGVATLVLARLLPRLKGLTADATSRHGAWLFLLWYAISLGVSLFASRSMGVGTEESAGPSLSQLMALTAVANLAGVLAVMAVVVLASDSLRSLGLGARAPDPARPSAWLVAPAMWLSFGPLFALVAWLNSALLAAFDIPSDLQMQLQMFVADSAARSSPWVWISIGVITPVCEEIAFRGLLYGGLRRMGRPTLAMVGSAVVFGTLHEPTVILPVTALGLLLAWSYERTGSLLVPCVIHALHNTATLALVAIVPAS